MITLSGCDLLFRAGDAVWALGYAHAAFAAAAAATMKVGQGRERSKSDASITVTTPKGGHQYQPEPWLGTASQAGPSRRGHAFWCRASDPYGVACVVLTNAIAISTSLLVNLCVLLPRLDCWVTYPVLVVYNWIIVMMLVAQAFCMCTNPGTARDYIDPLVNAELRKTYEKMSAAIAACEAVQGESHALFNSMPGRRKWWCKKCDTFRPKHTHHCSTCNACVLNMDHHCPWVNNCVGWRNHKHFVLFLWYAWWGCVASMAILAYMLLAAAPAPLLPNDGDGANTQRLSVAALLVRRYLPPIFVLDAHAFQRNIWLQLAGVLAMVVCLWLSIFASAMCYEQCEALTDGYGIVDRKQLQGMHGSAGADDSAGAASTASAAGSHPWFPGHDKLARIMGGPVGISWFLPTSPGLMEKAVVTEDSIAPFVRERLRRQQQCLDLARSTSVVKDARQQEALEAAAAEAQDDQKKERVPPRDPGDELHDAQACHLPPMPTESGTSDANVPVQSLSLMSVGLTTPSTSSDAVSATRLSSTDAQTDARLAEDFVGAGASPLADDFDIVSGSDSDSDG